MEQKIPNDLVGAKCRLKERPWGVAKSASGVYTIQAVLGRHWDGDRVEVLIASDTGELSTVGCDHIQLIDSKQ